MTAGDQQALIICLEIVQSALDGPYTPNVATTSMRDAWKRFRVACNVMFSDTAYYGRADPVFRLRMARTVLNRIPARLLPSVSAAVARDDLMAKLDRLAEVLVDQRSVEE